MFHRLVRFVWLCAALTAISAHAQTQTTWFVNNLTNIGGYVVGKYGAPTVVSTPYGNAVHFNGVNDGLVVSNNPLAGFSTNLTVELIFKHDQLTVPTAWQPRIVHVQTPSPPDHRFTLETRVLTNGSQTAYYLDTFLRYSNNASYFLTLTNANQHPLDEWAHMAVTYDGTNFRNFVNARLENSGLMSGLVFTTGGFTSIGMRGNLINYFQGSVLAVRFTPRVLATNEFLCVPRTRVDTFTVTNQISVADFALTSGLPIGFTLQEAAAPAGPWTNQTAATLTTNTPGISYRFITAATNNTRFYRVHWP